MDITALMLAYTAAAVVALAVTAAFSPSIEHMLFRLLPEDLAPHWAQFLKFALVVISFAGGMPSRVPSGIIDRNAPPAPPPGVSEGVMLIMGSASGALMAAAWVLFAFFAVTLTALSAGRAYAALREYREKEAREVAKREEERKAEKARQDRSESHGEPVKRQEPAEARPVPQDKSETATHRRR